MNKIYYLLLKDFFYTSTVFVWKKATEEKKTGLFQFSDERLTGQ